MVSYSMMSARERSLPFAFYEQGDEAREVEVHEPLAAYPELSRRPDSALWLSRYDEASVEAADAFVVSRPPNLDPEAIGHDLTVYLCDWVVSNVPSAYWVLHPDGFCFVKLGTGLVDPYLTVVESLKNGTPIARKFVNHCKAMASG